MASFLHIGLLPLLAARLVRRLAGRLAPCRCSLGPRSRGYRVGVFPLIVVLIAARDVDGVD
eukprot:6178805-Pleurochrysis_carterae.AAC.2